MVNLAMKERVPKAAMNPDSVVAQATRCQVIEPVRATDSTLECSDLAELSFSLRWVLAKSDGVAMLFDLA
jgi:hypothetical protein